MSDNTQLTKVGAFEASPVHAEWWQGCDVAVWVEPMRSGARWLTGWQVREQEGHAGRGGNRVNQWPYLTKRAALRYARRYTDAMLGSCRTYVAVECTHPDQLRDERDALRRDRDHYISKLVRDRDHYISKLVELWHTKVGGTCGPLSLHEFLGWTWEQHNAWVENPQNVPPLARREADDA